MSWPNVKHKDSKEKIVNSEIHLLIYDKSDKVSISNSLLNQKKNHIDRLFTNYDHTSFPSIEQE